LESTERKYTGNKNIACSIGNEEKNFNHVIDVYFDTFQKRYYFLNNPKFSVKINDQVIVETQMGLAIGKVVSVKKNTGIKNAGEPLKMIIRVATKKDIEKNNELKSDAIKAGYIFKNKLKKYSLNLKLVSTEYTFDKKKLIFYFASEDRVDFRDLVKELAAIFRVRIELRQIGVRDYAKMVGDCGSCGKTLCCKSIINKFDSVSIKMAREQGVSVAPSKISGVCGRLKCCMGFENSQYMEVKEDYPAIGQSVITVEGEGNVTSMNMLNDLIFVNIEGKGLQKYSLAEIKFNKIEKMEIEKRQVCSYEESN
jgi:tpl protein